MNRLDEIKAKFATIINNKFAIGCSGGVDSMVLTFLLRHFNYDVTGIIVNHNLRKNSTEEACKVSQVLQKWGVNAHVLRLDGFSLNESGLEEKMRQMRYKVMQERMLEIGLEDLILAHHKDDQVETFLMRLERGSGLRGLCSIREMQVYEGITLIRPFLNLLTKTEIYEIAHEFDVEYFEDETNRDTKIKRNFIRDILQKNTAGNLINTRIFRTVQILQGQLEILERRITESYNSCVEANLLGFVRINLTKFTNFSPAEQSEIFIRAIKLVSGLEMPPNYEQVQNIIRQIKELKTTLSHCKIITHADFIYIFKEPSHTPSLSLILPAKTSKTVHFDNRFNIRITNNSSKDMKLVVKPLTKHEYADFKTHFNAQNLPKFALLNAVLTHPFITHRENLEWTVVSKLK
jgi:tRNA(Ile)-lysidine synthase